MLNIQDTNQITHPYNPQEVLPSQQTDQLTSFISQELRTPLTSLRGALGLIHSGKLDSLPGQSKHLLEIAINNTNRLIRLTAAIENTSVIPAIMMTTTAINRLRLETDLFLALDRQEFKLVYQPIVNVETNQISGFEALVRWQHPRQGFISPTEFIPLAEETGLIHTLGLWVLRKACSQLSAWQQQLPNNPPLSMSVNISSLQLSEPNLVEQIQQILHQTNLTPNSLRLEITESTLNEHWEKAIASLWELKNLGIQLYIDDFGTGYSSLSRLQDFPLDTLKIDRSFISGQKWDIIRVIMLLASSLELEVIAEGVETVEELEKIKELGCKYIQGYLFSKPVDAQKAIALAREHNRIVT